ncbi:ANTAR domain-containing protein [Pedococcus sp. 2YAF34]|uniref:ANTAR domain-containing protein n=1 Tax=Pedococcus sp. 2YAF34 TaxID=3233032 RepID=UPI003F9DEEF0
MARLEAAHSDGQTMYFEYEAESARWTWSAGLRALHALSAGEEPTTELMLERMAEEDRAVMLSRFKSHLEQPGPYSCAYHMTDAGNRQCRLLFVGQSEAVDGKVKRLSGFVVDLTEPMRETARAAVAASVEHRAAIEQAKGALMLSFGVEEDIAFDLLRAYSSRHNIKLAVVAERIVAGLSDPAFSRDEPVRSLLDIVISLSGGAPSDAGHGARQVVEPAGGSAG